REAGPTAPRLGLSSSGATLSVYGASLSEIPMSGSDVVPAAEPAISIVVATFNAGAILSRCVDSVLDQDHRSVDLVIIDGGSTDGTIERIRGYGDRIAHWESAPDNGVYDAWN